MSRQFNRPILFTELGYKSTADAAVEPWQWVDYEATPTPELYSPETQANCYQAFFNAVWGQEWFAGVHLWQFRSDDIKRSRDYDLDFTPQGKLAEEVITKGFE